MSRTSTARIVRPADQVTSENVPSGRATVRQVLIGQQDGAPHFAMRRFTMGEGGGMPLHTNTVEHQQYVLRGRARVEIGGQVYDVKPDDVIYIPAGEPHSYQVVEAPFEFLCMVPNAPDRLEVLEGC
jgi:quercetin dioxygenase-like cupin family protein